jgi:thiol-disulfide isomerase/thioredoxin
MKKGVVIAVAAAIAAAAGYFAQRHYGTATPPAAPASATPVASADADAATVTPDDPAATPSPTTIPEKMPDIMLADRDGKMRQLSEWAGRPLMVNYWATWCAPCRREIPLLNELRAGRAATGLEVIGIAVDFREDVLKYAAATPINYPLLIGEEDGLAAVQAVGLQPAFPFTVFTDSQLRIVALKVGELHRDEAELILERVAQVDKGTLELAAARDQISAGLKELATRRATERQAKDQPAG